MAYTAHASMTTTCAHAKTTIGLAFLCIPDVVGGGRLAAHCESELAARDLEADSYLSYDSRRDEDESLIK